MATFYISPNGDDVTGDGSEALPWLNLNHAIGGSASTDTIIIKSGVTVQTEGLVNVNLENRTLIGETSNPAENVVDFGGLHCSRIAANINCVIERFTIQNIRQTAALPVFSSFSVNTFEPASFSSMILRDIWIGGSGNFSLPSSGLFGQCKVTIKDSLIHQIKWVDGMGADAQIFGLDRFDGFVKLENVTYYDDSVAPTGSLNVPRIFASRQGPGESVEFELKNCILSVKDPNAITDFVETFSAGFVFSGQNSCVHNVNYNQTGTNMITTDPLFVDPENGNFRLRPGSPCIGTGSL